MVNENRSHKPDGIPEICPKEDHCSRGYEHDAGDKKKIAGNTPPSSLSRDKVFIELGIDRDCT